MNLARPSLLRGVALAALACAAGAAQATITVSTSLAGFTTAAGGTVSTDSFSNLTINQSLNTLTTSRTAGALGYALSSSSLSTDTVNSPSGLYVAPVAGNIAITTQWYADTLTLNNFASPVKAVGANVFGTNILGELATLALTIKATDVNGLTLTTTSAGSSISGFVGFVSDVPLASFVVSATAPSTDRYVTLDNVVLAAAPVPEPASWLLMLVGAAAVLSLGKRRRA